MESSTTRVNTDTSELRVITEYFNKSYLTFVLSSPSRSWEFFSSPPLRDRFWGPSNLLFKGQQGLLARGFGRDVKLTIHLHLVPRSRMRRAILPPSNTTPWRDAQLRTKAQGQL
jgi:hypothetical protein